MQSCKLFSKFVVLALAGLWVAQFAHPTSAGGGGKPAKDNLNLISMEVQALQAIDSLELTPKQLEVLAVLAKESRDKLRKREPAKVSPEYRQVLLDLHAALLKKDEDKVSELDAKLEELGSAEPAPELDTDFEVTDAARAKASEFLKMLTPTQVASYLSTLTIPDPLEILGEALESGADLKGEEWVETRDEAAAEVARLLGGLSPKRVGDVGAQLRKALDKVHSAKETKVNEEMELLIAKGGPIVVLRNTVEAALAEMMSNPRLGPGLAARKQATK